VLINHFELVMLVVDVWWNKMMKCTGDLSRCSVEKESGDVWWYNARKCNKIHLRGSSKMVEQLYDVMWPLLIIA